MRSLLALLATAVVLAVPAGAGAATIVVDTTEPDSTSQCGLVNAVNAANSNAVSAGCRGGSIGSPDRIEFELPPRATIMLDAALPTILSRLEIVGPGAEQLVVSGGDAGRVFTVAAPAASITDLTVADGAAERAGAVSNEAGSTLVLSRLSLEGNEVTLGSPIPVYGGAIQNEGALTLSESTVRENVVRAPAVALGGGIANMAGTMTIVRSTIDDNEAVVTTSGAGAIGGGIYSNAELTIRDSTISRNRSTASATPGPNLSEGGGVGVSASGTTTIERSTIAANASVGQASGLIRGGGFSVVSNAAQLISASTIAGNTAPSSANVYNDSPVAVRGTIVAEPLGGGGNCAGPVDSLGFNLEQGSSCGLSQLSDQSGTDPLLGPLAANGGPTETLALLPGSPALDRGFAALGEVADQRGLRRPIPLAGLPSAPGGNGADVGAFELQAPRAAIVRGPGEGETIANPEPSFEFGAEGAAAGFLCALDGGAPLPCASPLTTPPLGDGPHSFSVEAVGADGYGQPAATRGFTVAIRQPEPRPDVPARTEPTKPAAELKPAAPVASIGGLPARTTKRRLTIRLSSDQPGSSFACKLDRRPWRGCRSPYRTPQLALGRHTLQVQVTGPTGVAAAPVRKGFRVVAPPRRG